jgi:hypothetical protein
LNLNAHFSKRNEGTLQFKIPKLSSYKDIDKLEEVYSTKVLFLHNLPFRLCVQFEPNKENHDTNVGIYLDATMIKEIHKTELIVFFLARCLS